MPEGHGRAVSPSTPLEVIEGRRATPRAHMWPVEAADGGYSELAAPGQWGPDRRRHPRSRRSPTKVASHVSVPSDADVAGICGVAAITVVMEVQADSHDEATGVALNQRWRHRGDLMDKRDRRENGRYLRGPCRGQEATLKRLCSPRKGSRFDRVLGASELRSYETRVFRRPVEWPCRQACWLDPPVTRFALAGQVHA